MNNMYTYVQKLQIANNYLYKFGISWDDLPDINSLHDVEDVEDIWELCNDRLKESGFNTDDFEGDTL